MSPLVGVRFKDRARLSLQYDHITDNLARDATGVPTDLRNDQVTLRLQVDDADRVREAALASGLNFRKPGKQNSARLGTSSIQML